MAKIVKAHCCSFSIAGILYISHRILCVVRLE